MHSLLQFLRFYIIRGTNTIFPGKPSEENQQLYMIIVRFISLKLHRLCVSYTGAKTGEIISQHGQVYIMFK